MNLLLFAISAALYTFTAWRLQRRLLSGASANGVIPLYLPAVAAAVLLAAQVVLTAEILSTFKMLSSPAAWLAVGVVFAILAALCARTPHNQTIAPLKFHGLAPKLVALAYAGLFLIALLMPPNTWDSMTYHLSRVGYWLAQGHLGHFPTNNIRQTDFPVNAEVLMLWPVVFLRADWLCALIQFAAAVLCAIAVYGIAREMKLPARLASLSALIALGFPQIALQATSTQNDLVCGFFVLAAVLFAFSREGFGSLALSGISAGLAFGTKPMALFFVPGLLLVLIAKHRASPVRIGGAIAALSLSLAVFAGPQMLRNWKAKGYLLPQVEITRVQHPTPHTVALNAFRTGVDLIDSNDLPYPFNRGVGVIKRAAAQKLVKDFDAFNPPDATFPGLRFEFKGNNLSEDVAWYGISGTLLTALAAIGLLRSGRLRLTWFAYAALPVGFIAACVILLRWQPWSARFYCAAMILLIPLGLRGVLGLRLPPKLRRAAFGFFAALAVSGSFVVLVMNEIKPLIARPGEHSVFSLTRSQQRCRHRPYNETMSLWLKDKPPLNVGFCANEDQWDYLAFGEDFRHKVVRFGEAVPWNTIFSEKRCDVIFVQRGFVAIPALPGFKIMELNEEWTLITPAN